MATDTTHISNEVQDALSHFIDTHPTNRVSRNLRKLLVESLQNDAVIEDQNFKEIIYNIQGLFDLLDSIENE